MNKFLILPIVIIAISLLSVAGFAVFNNQSSFKQICDYQQMFNGNDNVLNYEDNQIVGISKQDKVLILDLRTCGKNYIQKPEGLKYRPFSDLQKVDDLSFSFIITAQPHYGHYYVYNLKGTQLIHNILVDECYITEQVPIELKEKAINKCQTNPELKIYDDLIKDLEFDQ